MDITQFQALSGKISDLSYLCIFGCQIYVFIPKKKRVQNMKWDPRNEYYIFVGYDKSEIYSLWNGYRVIWSKDIIFDKISICLVISPRITLPANTSSTKLITLLSIYNTSLRHFAKSMYFLIKLHSLNEALKNDRGEGLDYSHTPPHISQKNVASSLLSSLGLTPDPVLGTSVL